MDLVQRERIPLVLCLAAVAVTVGAADASLDPLDQGAGVSRGELGKPCSSRCSPTTSAPTPTSAAGDGPRPVIAAAWQQQAHARQDVRSAGQWLGGDRDPPAGVSLSADLAGRARARAAPA